MRVPRTYLATMALLFVACGQEGPTHQPATLAEFGFSLSVQVVPASSDASGLSSPVAIQLTVRDASGRGAPIIGGSVLARDSANAPLAEAPIARGASGHSSVELTWPDTALARRLDIRVDVRDSDGILHTVEHTLPL
jgi:hypothetical protein